jgi:hypothetical protein
MAESADLLVALVLLPLEYNQDASGQRREIEEPTYLETMAEIARRFGGGVLWRWPAGERPRGFWWSRGILHDDHLAVIEVDIPDEPAARAWLTRYARRVLIPRFQQDAIYIRMVGPIHVSLVTVGPGRGPAGP